MATLTTQQLEYRRFAEGRLIGMRVNRYSWWTHWRELADYFLPRRYKWIITPNQQSRGSPINQHILDSTGVFAARNCASGLLSGKSSPTRRWIKLKFGHVDSTKPGPVARWLSKVERIMYMVLQESNFYTSIAQFYFDLVIFGTAVLIMYDDFENVVQCYNPCLGEYYIDLDGKFRPVVLYREFTMTIGALVNEFGLENTSPAVQALYKQKPGGANLTRELIVAHAIEPNDDGRDFGVPKHFKFREVYWEWTGSTSPQGGAAYPPAFLRVRGYHEQPHATVRWDIVSNDPYGRSPGMDGLPDQKQLQLEQRRKAQAIDKMVNPPMVADVQLKNQPASLLPGGVTYVAGFATSGKPGFASVYDTHQFPVKDIKDDMDEVRERLRKVFFNDIFQTASQFETRSNVTAMEWDMRKSEAMILLGPVFERVDHEGLKVIIQRLFGILSRAMVNGQPILPPAPPEIAGQEITVEFNSMLERAQSAAESAGIERLFQIVGGIEGIKPDAIDKINTDYALDKYSALLGNDPKLMNDDEAVMAIRQDRAKQQQAMQAAEMAEKLSKGAANLSNTDVGGGQSALAAMTGGGA